MDQPSAQAQSPAPQTQAPAHRDMMFCHECEDEWYRDEHGLTCPECGSDFTEIIEEGNDPRNNEHLPDIHEFLAQARRHDDNDGSMPSLRDGSPQRQPHAPGNPWTGHSDDPEEEDISRLQFRQLGPGRFAVTGTVLRAVSPTNIGNTGQQPQGGNQGAGLGGLLQGGIAGLLSSVIAGGRAASGNQATASAQNQASEGQGEPGTAPGAGDGSGATPAGHRFTYTASARLQPRDLNNPGPHMEPVDELNNILVGLMAAFGEQPAPHHHHHHHHHHGHVPVPLNPLMHIFAHMIPVNGQLGDAVYSQEALDRIISQLMEQNASSNAPGPASQDDIKNLPRKPVTLEMLGSDGKADCSICMEEVAVGEEVAYLPCTHWFHHPCIAAWLGEHDTCPHCRKGISKKSEDRNQGQSDSNAGAPAPPSPSLNMPGSFVAGGEGTSGNPYTLPNSPPPAPAAPANTDGNASGGAQEESSSGGGIGERLRRGLFGPPSRESKPQKTQEENQ